MQYPILLPNIFNHPFTYESNIKLKTGDYVLVPFGKIQATGVVWDKFEPKTNKNFKIKKVIKKMDIHPLKKTTINFLNWFAEYNILPKGMALKLVLLSSKDIEKFSIKKYENFHTKLEKKSFRLTKEQQNSLKKMKSLNDKFRVHVLQGTTGS